jgi:signal recognition particle GTPase
MPTMPCGFTFNDEHLEDPRGPSRMIIKLHRKKCRECRETIDPSDFKPRTTEQKKELKKITDTLEKHKKSKLNKDSYMRKVENKKNFNDSILSRDIKQVDKLALKVMNSYNKDRFTELAHTLEQPDLKNTIAERVIPLLEARERFKKGLSIKELPEGAIDFITELY